MKAKYVIIALLAITFWGCDDNTAGLGIGMFPGSDQNINGQLKTYPVTTESVAAGRIYAKTNIGYLGKFTDKDFGTYEAGFLSTLNCPDGVTFPGVYDGTAFDSKGKVTKTMVGKKGEKDDDITLIHDEAGNVIGNVHTVELILWYDSYFGDSLTACRLSAYELFKPLEEADNEAYYYTDIKPAEFYKEEDLLGTKAYTAVDLSVKDSIRNLSTYTPSIRFSFNAERAKKVTLNILGAARRSNSTLDRKTFINAFKGLYVKSDYGDGTILYVDQVQMNVVYKCYAVDSISGKKLLTKDGLSDSTFYDYRPFVSTREVYQANRLINDSKTDDLINETNCTFLKTPAGIFTQATLPIKKISEELSGDTLNAVRLSFSNYHQSNSNEKFGMTVPTNVMLIRKKDKESFFVNNQLTDEVSSFLTTHTNSTNQYTFSNITRLINACINERNAAEKEIHEKGSIVLKELYNSESGKFDRTETATTIGEWESITEWDKVVLIPVLVTYDSSSSGGYGTPNVIGIQHDLKPGYAKLKGGSGEPLNMEVIFTNFSGTKATK